jgi:histone deacetylase complex regulatory component SIN3
VIHRVAKLFHEHNNLVMGFNEFLPPNLKIHISDSSIVGSTAQRSNVTVRLAVVSQTS